MHPRIWSDSSSHCIMANTINAPEKGSSLIIDIAYFIHLAYTKRLSKGRTIRKITVRHDQVLVWWLRRKNTSLGNHLLSKEYFLL